MAHLLAVFLVLVRRHVHDHHAAAGLQHPRRFGQPAAGAGTWCNTSMIVAASSSASSMGSASRVASPQVTFVASRAAPRGGSISSDASTAMTRATCGARAAVTTAGAATQVANDQRGVEQRRDSRVNKRCCRKLVAEPVPLSGRRGEELLRLLAAPGEHTLEPPHVLLDGRPARRTARARPPDLRAWRRHRAERAAWYRLVPSRLDASQPASPNVFRCRLTVDCGNCSTAQSSDTVSSCRSTSRSIRHRVGSARAERRVEERRVAVVT